MSVYSGLGLGWIRDTATYDENITNTSDKATSQGGVYTRYYWAAKYC